MKFYNYKIKTLGLLASSMLIMSGCGGDSSSPPAPDTTPPVFTNNTTTYNVTEGLSLDIDASATDDRGGVVKYSKDHAEFTINNIGILRFTAQTVNSNETFSVTVSATDESNNSATKNITVTVKDKGIENRAIMPQKSGRIFNDRGDGTVVNTHTSFLWQKDAVAGKSYDAAKGYCDGLSLGDVATWRLPTRMDLNKLINYDDFPIGFDTGFSDNHAGYWTDEEASTTTVWSIFFTGSGGDKEILKASEDIYTRCVSGEHKDARFNGDYDDTKRDDLDTNLEWDITKTTGTFLEAQNSCGTLGYRLPTFNEFLSIVEFDPRTVLGYTVDIDLGDTVSSASTEQGFGGNMWTSTGYEENDVNKTKVLYITPAEISDGGIEKNATAGIVCVK
jgi:hypothetical protein